MSDALDAAAREQTTAAAARDRDGLLAASRVMAAEGGYSIAPGMKIRSGRLTDRQLGSAILAGRGTELARQLRRHAFRQNSDGSEHALDRIAEDEYWETELFLLRELRALERDWRPLPRIPGRRDLAILSPTKRRRLVTASAA